MKEQERKQVQPDSRRAVFYLVLTTLLWGGSFVFNKIGLRDLPPVVFMADRFAVATVLMGFVARRRLLQLNADLIRRGVLVGLALAVANLTFVFGVAGTTISRAGFLNNLFVLIIPLFGFLFWRYRVDRLTLAGVVLACAGLALLAGGGVTGGFSRGDFYSSLCAVFISLHILAVSRLLHQCEVFAVTFVQFLTVAVVAGFAVALFPVSSYVYTSSALLSLGYCIVFPTVICFTLQNTYQRYVSPAQAGLIYTLDPIWVLLGGMLILGERLTLAEWFACSLIFSAAAMPLAGRLLREHFSQSA